MNHRDHQPEPVEVRVAWPGGGTSIWRSDKPIIDSEGVGPVGVHGLAAHCGMLTGVGVLIPLDESGRWFVSTVPRDRLAENLLALLAMTERQERGESPE